MTTELRDTSPAPVPPPPAGWLSRTTLVITFIGMAGSVVAMAVSHLKG